MRFCPNCNHEQEQGDICSKCGNPFDMTILRTAIYEEDDLKKHHKKQPVDTVSKSEDKETKPKRTISLKLLLVLFPFIVLVCIGGTYIGIDLSEDKDNSDTPYYTENEALGLVKSDLTKRAIETIQRSFNPAGASDPELVNTIVGILAIGNWRAEYYENTWYIHVGGYTWILYEKTGAIVYMEGPTDRQL